MSKAILLPAIVFCVGCAPTLRVSSTARQALTIREAPSEPIVQSAPEVRSSTALLLTEEPNTARTPEGREVVLDLPRTAIVQPRESAAKIVGIVSGIVLGTGAMVATGFGVAAAVKSGGSYGGSGGWEF